jgi:hypothetical protein
MNYQKISLSVLGIGLLLFTSISCDKKEDCVAGTGGNVTIAAFPKHHGEVIYSQANYPDTAYLKFNTQDFPGESPLDYDLVVVAEEGEDHVHISGLKCGEYYIYMTGWDTSINQRVKGGIPYSFEQTSGEIDLTVPVTED